jgi:hypothetical protein
MLYICGAFCLGPSSPPTKFHDTEKLLQSRKNSEGTGGSIMKIQYNNWPISECSGLCFGRNLSRGAKLLSSSLGIASRLQQNDKPKISSRF